MTNLPPIPDPITLINALIKSMQPKDSGFGDKTSIRCTSLSPAAKPLGYGERTERYCSQVTSPVRLGYGEH